MEENKLLYINQYMNIKYEGNNRIFSFSIHDYKLCNDCMLPLIMNNNSFEEDTFTLVAGDCLKINYDDFMCDITLKQSDNNRKYWSVHIYSLEYVSPAKYIFSDEIHTIYNINSFPKCLLNENTFTVGHDDQDQSYSISFDLNLSNLTLEEESLIYMNINNIIMFCDCLGAIQVSTYLKIERDFFNAESKKRMLADFN